MGYSPTAILESAQDAPAEGSWPRWAWAAALVSALSPLLLAEIPAMGDYPNHLARMHLLTTEGNSFYQVQWRLVPYLTMDIVVPPLAHIMGVEWATKAFLGISQLLIVSGATVLEIVVKRRIQIAPFVALALLYGLPFSWGFVNFEFGVGAALWGIAGWIALSQRPLWRVPFNLITVPALFFSHPMALGAYGATIFTYECWRFWRGQTNPTAAAVTLAVMCAPPIALIIIVLSYSPQPLGVGDIQWFHWLLSQKVAIFHVFDGYNRWIAALMFGLCLWLVVEHRRMLSWIAPGKWLAIIFLALFLALPVWLVGTAFVDTRIPIMAALILPAFVAVDRPALNTLRAGLLVLAIVSVAHVAFVWTQYQAHYRDIKASFAKIQKGSKVLVASMAQPTTNLREFPIMHAPALAVHYSDALVTSLFSNPRILIVSVRDDLRDAYPPIGTPVRISELLASDSWKTRFDYLYVVGSQEDGNFLPASLDLLQSGELFALYQIKRLD
jgi:hypothetical protein